MPSQCAVPCGSKSGEQKFKDEKKLAQTPVNIAESKNVLRVAEANNLQIGILPKCTQIPQLAKAQQDRFSVSFFAPLDQPAQVSVARDLFMDGSMPQFRTSAALCLVCFWPTSQNGDDSIAKRFPPWLARLRLIMSADATRELFHPSFVRIRIQVAAKCWIQNCLVSANTP